MPGLHRILLLLASFLVFILCPGQATLLLRGAGQPGYGSRGRPLRMAEVLSLQNPSASGGGTLGGAATSDSKSARLPTPPRLSKNNMLRYFQGPLVVTPAPVHLIYYGNWKSQGSKTQTMIRKFLASITARTPSGPGSVASWWGINSLLSQKEGQLTTSNVFLKSEHVDSYSQGKVLASDTAMIFQVVQRQLAQGSIVHTPGAMYVVITSADVRVGGSSGFCGSYCGWHDYKAYTPAGSSVKQDIYFAFVGDGSTQCPVACGISDLATPSGAVDAVVDTFAHEIAEISTDPDAMTGWLTDQASWGQENADICRRVYQNQKNWVSKGVTYKYNLEGVNGTKFLVQSNYNPVKAKCTISP